MILQSTQLSLPLHDVSKTQALRERLEKDEVAKQDLVDIMSLPQDQAELRIGTRQEARIKERIKVDGEKKWSRRLYGASAAGIAAAVVAGSSGNGGLAVALGIGSMLSFATGTAIAATAGDQRNLSGLVKASDSREQLLKDIQEDPQLVPHLRQKEDWMKKNRAPEPQESSEFKPAPKEGFLADLAGKANVAKRAPHIFTAPIVHALSSPNNLAEEALNEANGVEALYVGLGALAGAGLGAAAMLAQPQGFGVVEGMFALVCTGLGSAMGAMGGAISAQAKNGVSEPLNIGRKTATELGEGKHSLWTRYKTGVNLGIEEAYRQGAS